MSSTWLTPNLLNQVAYNLHYHREIPDWIGYYTPAIVDVLSSFQMKKMIPHEGNQILYREKGLLTRGVASIARRTNSHKINLFDIAETTGESILPLIYDLIEEDLLYQYIPVTCSYALNEVAIERLTLFCLNARLPVLKHDAIVAEPEISDFRPLVIDSILDSPDTTHNVFLLNNSRLGNSLEPIKMLSNIYRSMDQGDNLMIVQGIYRSGVEATLLADYRSMFSDPVYMQNDIEMAAQISQETDFQVTWDSTISGVKLSFKTVADTKFAGVDLTSGEEITLFRSVRFQENTLRQMFREVGFKILDIAYDDEMDNALFFLEK